MKQEKKQPHSIHAFLVLVGIIVIAIFFISIATYIKVSSLEQGQSSVDTNTLTGQAQKILEREKVSFDLAPALEPRCLFEKVGPTSYKVTRDCAYPLRAEIFGPKGDAQRVAVYQGTKSPPTWNFAHLAEYNPTQGWDAKTVLSVPLNQPAQWNLNLRFPHMPGEYTYRIATVNGNCKQTWTHIPRKQCQGFLEGAYKDYSVKVE